MELFMSKIGRRTKQWSIRRITIEQITGANCVEKFGDLLFVDTMDNATSEHLGLEDRNNVV